MAMGGAIGRATVTCLPLRLHALTTAIPFFTKSQCGSLLLGISSSSRKLYSASKVSFPAPLSNSLPGRFSFEKSCTMSSASVETAPTAASTLEAEVDGLDIRVGRIVKVWKHPEADSLYVEEVDIAEAEGPRTICSGLVKHIPIEELEDRAVLVLANLKARNMRGVKSNGMLLAASDADHETVELLSPPTGAVSGERIWFGSDEDKTTQAPAATPNQLQKKKIWETVQPLLKTTDECVATFQSKPMRTSAGVVTCKSLKQANIA